MQPACLRRHLYALVLFWREPDWLPFLRKNNSITRHLLPELLFERLEVPLRN